MLKKIFHRFKLLLGGGFVTQQDLNMSALDIGIDTATGNAIQGDYLEFGVYRGNSFCRAFHRFKQNNDTHERRFIAFDSFEGLPDSNEDNKPPHYTKGAYASSQAEFQKTLRQHNVDTSRVLSIKGFYNTTLCDETKKEHNIKRCAVAYIDVDLYSSSVSVFNFLTDIIDTGSILVIDDWFRHTGTKNSGIQKACSEWLENNPSIRLTVLHQWRRVAFIVEKNEG